MTMSPRLILASLLTLAPLPLMAAHVRTKPAPAKPAISAPAAPEPAAPSAPAAAVRPDPAWPSFMVRNEVICFDELDYNAFAKTGRFHTRGSQESCTHMDELTRVTVLNKIGPKAQVLVVSGPLTAHVGWTNAQLPLAGHKPAR